MSEPFLSEIRIFASNFAPQGWAFCNGQLLPISQNTALFSLIGTTYGGDGETTTALPDLQGRVPMHAGAGPGLTPHQLGEKGGFNEITLTEAQMPVHRHSVAGYSQTSPSGVADPEDNLPTVSAGRGAPALYAASTATPKAAMAQVLRPQGGSLSHNNQQPFIAVHFIIALVGTYPTEA